MPASLLYISLVPITQGAGLQAFFHDNIGVIGHEISLDLYGILFLQQGVHLLSGGMLRYGHIRQLPAAGCSAVFTAEGIGAYPCAALFVAFHDLRGGIRLHGADAAGVGAGSAAFDAEGGKLFRFLERRIGRYFL